MGIKSVNKTATEQAPEAFFVESADVAKNQRVFIDTPFRMYAMKSSAIKEYVNSMKDPLEEIDNEDILHKILARALDLQADLLDQDILGVWLLDGETPKEKIEIARQERKEARETIGDKVKALKDKLLKQDVMERSKADLQLLRKLLRQYVVVITEEMTTVENVLRSFGQPVIQCPGEAEMYACAMNKKGLGFAVYTTDTDCYCGEGVNMITEINQNQDGMFFSMVHIPTLRKKLKFNVQEMRDFCIMCGTDFNKNIPNLGVGRAFKFITKHRSIEKFSEKEDKDCEILNYKKSRKLLTPPVCELEHDSPELNLNPQVFLENAREVSRHYQLGTWYARISFHMKRQLNINKFYDRRGKPKIILNIKGKSPVETSVKSPVEIMTENKTEENVPDKEHNCARVPVIIPSKIVTSKVIKLEELEELE
jgi:5'-3' exonuclease